MAKKEENKKNVKNNSANLIYAIVLIFAWIILMAIINIPQVIEQNFAELGAHTVQILTWMLILLPVVIIWLVFAVLRSLNRVKNSQDRFQIVMVDLFIVNLPVSFGIVLVATIVFYILTLQLQYRWE